MEKSIAQCKALGNETKKLERSERPTSKKMGQSLNKIYVHIAFCTKHRKPLISEEIEDELFSYLGSICKNLECNPLKIGSYKDHIHILCLLSKKNNFYGFD